MKFGEYLREQLNPEWKEMYMDYDRLKKLIKLLEEVHLGAPRSFNTFGTSLSVPVPTNAAGMPDNQQISQEDFFNVLESEMKKIERFTKEQASYK